MNRIGWLCLASVLLAGCAAPSPRGGVPVIDASAPLPNAGRTATTPSGRVSTPVNAPRMAPTAPARDAGIVVMVPDEFNATPIQASPVQESSPPLNTTSYAPSPAPAASVAYAPAPASAPTFIAPTPAPNAAPTPPNTSELTSTSGFSVRRVPVSGAYIPPSAPIAPAPVPSAPTSSGLAADEQLDGPVLALLTSAQQMERGGNLSGASSNLERAQRIAPREPQILYRLAEVRLAQGDAAQAEQLARRGLSYATGRPALQASLWDVIARARESQGDAAGAADARQRTKVAL